MGFFKKYGLFLLVAGLILLYFVTRFYHILSLPIFTDEAIYIRWSQIAKQDASWRFISLTDGKQPMYVWLAMLSLRFIHDPLLAGRVVSVFAGFFSAIGMFFLASEIFKNKKIGYIASLLYIIFPFALVYDRMAMYDSLVSMFIMWSLYFEVLLVRHIRLDLALILGMIIGGGMLTKMNDAFALAYLPCSLLLFNFSGKKRKEKLLQWVMYAFTAGVLAFLIYSILRLSPFYYIIDQKTATFVYPLKEWLQHPFTYFGSNLSGLVSWLTGYVTVPFLLLIGASFLTGAKQTREKLFLLIAFAGPFFYLTFFGRTIYPRFILFMTIPLLVLAAYALYSMEIFTKKLWVRIAVFIAFLTMFVVNDFLIITNFANARIPKADLGQYITGWPSGVGVKETVQYLQEQAKDKKIYVLTEGTFGLMPYAIEMYLVDNPNVTIKGMWPLPDQLPSQYKDIAQKMPVYVVFYQPCPSCKYAGVAPIQWPLKQIFQIQKDAKDTYYTLYQIQPR